MKKTALSLISLAVFTVSYAQTFYVSPNGTGDCSVNNPCSLEVAINQAAANTDNDTIYLKSGIYHVNNIVYRPADKEGNLTIEGQNNVILDAGLSGRVLEIDTTSVNDDGTEIIIKNLTVQNGLIEDNNDKGAGIKIDVKYADVFIEKVTFKNNTVTLDADGAGLYVNSSTGNITVKNSTFENNNADNYSGGFDLTTAEGKITVEHSVIKGNSGGYGGGGSLETDVGRIDIVNNIIVNNRSTSTGDGRGGGILINLKAGETYIINNTISDNYSSAYGGGVHIKAFDNNGKMLIYNNIIYFNTADKNGDDFYIETEESQESKYTPFIKIGNNDYHYSFIENLDAIISTGEFKEEENINNPPEFVNREQGDYHIKNTSPCIDKGDPSPILPVPETDIDGEPRLMGNSVDIGADEVPVNTENGTDENSDKVNGSSGGGGGGGCSLAPATSPANALLYLVLPLFLLLRRFLRK